MSNKTVNAILLILIAAAVLAGGVYYFMSAPAENAGVRAGDPRNASYVIEGKTVSLKDGISTEEIMPGSASKTVTRYFGNEAKGDFDGNGTEDVAFLLTQETGGSGTFFYAAAALKTAGGYEGTNAVFLGDRIAPQTTEYRNGEIIVNFAERNPGEPMTAQPSVGVSKYLKIDGGRLVEAPEEISCPAESRNAEVCAQIYAPVCALVQVQCIKAPCYPVPETFPSACEACRNSLVKSYTPGECGK